jgi:hypothetical protein
MATPKPTYEQAQLQLRLYEDRREPKLREARDWFFKNYIVENLDDAMKIAGPGTQGGTYAMMVLTYWDQACAFLNHGLLHEDLFFETSGEFFGVWEAAKPVIPAIREKFSNKLFLGNLEKASQSFEKWMESRSPGSITAMRQMMKQMRQQQQQQSKAA